MIDVLIVDDEAPLRRLMHRWVDAAGATAVDAESAEQALLLAARDSPRVVLCDIRLPRGQTGVWMVEQLARLHPQTAVIIMTGLPDFDPEAHGLTTIAGFMVKPFTQEELGRVLAGAFVEHEARKRAAASLVEIDGRDSRQDPDSADVSALVAVLKAQGEPDAHRAIRVSEIAVALADGLDVAGSQRLDIGRAALLRNVERLDVRGVARQVPHLDAAAAIAAASEERFDGKGFPLGLTGSAIPLGARIIAAADAFDAATTVGRDRSDDEVIDALERERPGAFDPAVLRALRAVSTSFSAPR